MNCTFCGRDVEEVGNIHYHNPDTEEIACADCGVAPQDQKALPAPQEPPQEIDLSLFFRACDQIAKERVRQIMRYGYTAKADSKKSLADFIVYMEQYMDRCKAAITAHDPDIQAEARNELVKVITLGMAYLESHPFGENV